MAIGDAGASDGPGPGEVMGDDALPGRGTLLGRKVGRLSRILVVFCTYLLPGRGAQRAAGEAAAAAAEEEEEEEEEAEAQRDEDAPPHGRPQPRPYIRTVSMSASPIWPADSAACRGGGGDRGDEGERGCPAAMNG